MLGEHEKSRPEVIIITGTGGCSETPARVLLPRGTSQSKWFSVSCYDISAVFIIQFIERVAFVSFMER